MNQTFSMHNILTYSPEITEHHYMFLQHINTDSHSEIQRNILRNCFDIFRYRYAQHENLLDSEFCSFCVLEMSPTPCGLQDQLNPYRILVL